MKSFDEFKNTPAYETLSDEEKRSFARNPPDKIVVLQFKSLDDARKCLTQMIDKGLIPREAQNKIMEQLQDQEHKQTAETNRSFRR